MKSFETGLRDDVLATNLRPILRQTGLSDEELMKRVNELASHQARGRSKLARERRSAKINKCEVENLEIKTPALADDSKQNLKQQNGNERSNDNREVLSGREFGKPTRFRGRGCQACKKRGRGSSYRHCFACGNFGHIASECIKI